MKKIDVLSRISAEMHQALHANTTATSSDIPTDDITQMRALYEQDKIFWNQGGPDMVSTLELSVPTPYGPVATRIYYPKQDKLLPGIFYIHGGGFILGNVNTHDRIMRILAAESGCAVIGIDYTLSPEAKFPQAIEECSAVTQYFHHCATEYHLDGQQLGYAGDSAGAHLCLATLLWQRDKGMDTDFIKAMMLYYGLYGLNDSRTQRLYGGPWDGLTQEDLAYYKAMYFADEGDEQSPYYNLLNNLLNDKIPPCFIAGSEFDPLLDDSETLHDLLQENKISSQFRIYEGTLHAFLHCSRVLTIAHQAISDGANFFNQSLTK